MYPIFMVWLYWHLQLHMGTIHVQSIHGGGMEGLSMGKTLHYFTVVHQEVYIAMYLHVGKVEQQTLTFLI